MINSKVREGKGLPVLNDFLLASGCVRLHLLILMQCTSRSFKLILKKKCSEALYA